MSQRVNIQYSIKFDEIGQEVERLVEKAKSLLTACANDDSLSSEQLLSIDAYNNIDQLRLSLADVDATLADVNVIISSYLSYKTQEMMSTVASHPNPIQENGELPTDEDNLSELQNKIAHFKNKIASGNPDGDNEPHNRQD